LPSRTGLLVRRTIVDASCHLYFVPEHCSSPEPKAQFVAAPHKPHSSKRRLLTLGILRWYGLAFLVLALVSAVAGFEVGRLKTVWAKLKAVELGANTSAAAAPSQPTAGALNAEFAELTRLAPQQQAEQLLELAIRRQPASLDLIRQNADSWRGRLQNTDRLFDLVLTAMKSDDLRVRGAAIEVDLAANNLAKSPKTVARLVSLIRKDPSERPFALWRLGALGNRGVQPKVVLTHLVAFAHDPNEQTRFWAVEGLAMLGTDGAIDPMLDRFAHDPSPRVRQRAAVGIADSGMLTHEQRFAAVPDLLNFLDDDALDSDTRGWVYGALRLITGEALGNNAQAWQQWWAHHDSIKKSRSPKGVIFA
jgi:HEAT repeats